MTTRPRKRDCGHRAAALALFLMTGAAGVEAQSPPGAQADILIKNGHVVDGTGGPWIQGPPVPSTTWPFLMRISAWAPGGLCASTPAAPVRRKSASAAALWPQSLLRGRVVMISPPASRSARASVWRKDRYGNPALSSRLHAPLTAMAK